MIHARFKDFSRLCEPLSSPSVPAQDARCSLVWVRHAKRYGGGHWGLLNTALPQKKSANTAIPQKNPENTAIS